MDGWMNNIAAETDPTALEPAETWKLAVSWARVRPIYC